jgi:poly(A) polymerase
MKSLEGFITENQYIQMVKRLKGRRRLYVVGGTVRDIILGLGPADYDFAVSGSGISFARSFSRKINAAFVLLSKPDDEARVVKDDIIYDFIGIGKQNIMADLKRRDFTINSMAMNCDTLEFYDPFDGLKDLEKKILRLTTSKSLQEDPLRVLRGFRLSLELRFSLYKEFFKYAAQVNLKKTAAERIGIELLRIMAAGDSFESVLRMNTLGLFLKMLPEAKKIIEDDYLWTHSLGTYEAVESLMGKKFFKDFEPEFSVYFAQSGRIPLVKLAALFHDIAKPDTMLVKNGEVHFYGHDTKGSRIVRNLCCKRLKMSRSDASTVSKLVKEHMRLHLLATNSELTDRAIRRFFRDLGEDWLGAMMIAWADGYATAGWTKHLEQVFKRMISLKRADDAKPKVERLVNGHDLIALGLEPGPKFKLILQELLDLQLEEKITSKDEGLAIAMEINKRLDIAG